MSQRKQKGVPKLGNNEVVYMVSRPMWQAYVISHWFILAASIGVISLFLQELPSNRYALIALIVLSLTLLIWGIVAFEGAFKNGWKKRIARFLVAALATVIIGFLFKTQVFLDFWGIALGSIIFIVLGFAHRIYKTYTTQLQVTNLAVNYITYRWFWVYETDSFPLSKISHVRPSQNLLEKWFFGVGDIIIYNVDESQDRLYDISNVLPIAQKIIELIDEKSK